VVGCCPVVELRQYTLRPGQRDVLVELFDRELIEGQEATGMAIIGQFRDLDRPDRFVWLRGFPDMERRLRSLESFYGGPGWKDHSSAANATMIDVDDVLLLRPAGPTSGFGEMPPRPGRGEDVPSSPLIATVCSVDGPIAPDRLEQLLPALDALRPSVLAAFVEEPSENTFPALPVRVGEHVVVWLQRVASTDPSDLDASARASAELARALVPGLVADPVQLRLAPTARSRLR